MTATALAPAPSTPTTPQLALWCSEFGASYTERNDLERPARVDSLRTILGGLDVSQAGQVRWSP